MSAEIAPELKEKLRVIELETDFFWDKPEQPRFQKFAFAASLACLTIAITFAWEKLDPGLLVLLSIFPAFSLLQYFQSKRQYEQFTRACDLIRYYKNHSEHKAGTT